jgi:hypothetical protein
MDALKVENAVSGLEKIVKDGLALYGVKEREPLELRKKDIRFQPVDLYLRHLLWMAAQIREFLRAGRTEKAHRWLGYIQGAVSSPIHMLASIDQLRELNFNPEGE